ncbi:3-dehydroquinate synthase [Puteibacter caeruleilacunae]|nr:3-dehydroquinate synthase [Puteibacter caeruleilacunae]
MVPKIKSNVTFPQNIVAELEQLIATYPADKVFMVTEENTDRLCFPIFKESATLSSLKRLTIPAGEKAKTVETLSAVWQFLSENKADRGSLLINLGGGMLTDLCGFAASSFKRGMAFVNIPTTLLSQVDASVGGKTGINFNGFKNEIGVFSLPKMVYVDSQFLRTIDQQNFVSGYAEMIKHGLIMDKKHFEDVQSYDLGNIDYERIGEMVADSIAVKDHFVINDPTEKNIRKALNFGHTVGHAFESFAMKSGKPILHGYAVAYGMIGELFLSYKVAGFDKQMLQEISAWLIELYGKFEISTDDYEQLYQLMTHDKKNVGNRINFTLIPEVGSFIIDQNCSKELIFESLEFYKNL